MSNKTISMLKLRQVIRLYNQGKDTKAIAGMLSVFAFSVVIISVINGIN